MRPVSQTIHGVGGNCLGACIASVLECDLDVLPHPVDNNFFEWSRFLESHGILLLGGPHLVYWQAHWIGIVPSLNNEGRYHAVVMKGPSLEWEPNVAPSKLYEEVNYKDCIHSYLLVLSDAGVYRRSPLCAS